MSIVRMIFWRGCARSLEESRNVHRVVVYVGVRRVVDVCVSGHCKLRVFELVQLRAGTVGAEGGMLLAGFICRGGIPDPLWTRIENASVKAGGAAIALLCIKGNCHKDANVILSRGICPTRP